MLSQLLSSLRLLRRKESSQEAVYAVRLCEVYDEPWHRRKEASAIPGGTRLERRRAFWPDWRTSATRSAEGSRRAAPPG